MGGGQRENREALRQIFFQPRDELGCALGIVGDDLFESLLGGGATGAVEDAADGAGDLGALAQSWHIGLSLLLEMKLTPLPRDSAEDGFASGGQAGVVIADDELDARHTALDEALEESTPTHFGFTEGDAHAQDGTLAFGGCPAR